jgi:hypothetical protein
MGARFPLSDDERADAWQVLRQLRQHAIRSVGLLSDSDTARAALVAKIDVMLIDLGLLWDRLRVADRADARLRHCPGLQVPKSPATRRYDPLCHCLRAFHTLFAGSTIPGTRTSGTLALGRLMASVRAPGSPRCELVAWRSIAVADAGRRPIVVG